MRSLQRRRFFEFGPFQAFPDDGVLLHDGELVPLKPKVFDTLLVFVQNSGRVLTKDELMSAIWPDCFVDDVSLTQNIFLLRRSLEEIPGQLKYIETIPKRGYRFLASVIDNYTELIQSPQAAVSGEIKSIAVLPFNALGGCGDDELLGLGMADALITKLSNVRKITTRSTSSVLRYCGGQQDPMRIGLDLRVDLVLDGKIQRTNDRVRVTVQLINVETGTPLWAGKFDASSVDIFSLQDSISAQLLEALTLELTGAERELVAKHPTKNSEAYKSYLKGRYQWSKWTEDGLRKSRDCFNEAIQSEPNYAIAYAGLADAYSALAFYSYLSPHEAEAHAEIAARKALDIDEKLAEPHFSLATALFFHRWDWAGAEREFRRGVELNPSHALLQQGYGLFKVAMGRFQEAHESFRLALELDPVSPLINVTAGFPYFYSRQYDLACEQYRRSLVLDPDFGLAHAALAEVLVQKEMYDEALDEYVKAVASMGHTSDIDSATALALCLSGRRQEALEILNNLKELSLQRYVSACNIAMVYIGLNEIGHAFEWIGRAVGERAHRLVYLNVHPMYDTLRSDERFMNVRRRIGLGEAG